MAPLQARAAFHLPATLDRTWGTDRRMTRGRDPILQSTHLPTEEQCIDANAENRRIQPLLRQRNSFGVVQRSGSKLIVDSADSGAPGRIPTCALRLRRPTLSPTNQKTVV